MVVRAGTGLGEASLAGRVIRVRIDELDDEQAAREPERRLDGVREAALDTLPCDETVDDDLDVVLELLLERRGCGELHDTAVDPGPREALGLQLLEEVGVLALAAAHDRCEHLVLGALGQLEQAVDDLLRRLGRHALTAHRAVLRACASEQQAQVVVDLGDGADRRPRVAVGRLLVDRHGRGQALDEVDVGLVHLTEELARVCRQRLDVPALSLGEDRVEGERGLARAGQPGEDHERVAGQVEGDVLEVVLAGTTDDQAVGHRILLRQAGGGRRPC
jgi:hypothetical protein